MGEREAPRKAPYLPLFVIRILDLRAADLNYQQIATQLGISAQTVPKAIGRFTEWYPEEARRRVGPRWLRERAACLEVHAAEMARRALAHAARQRCPRCGAPKSGHARLCKACDTSRRQPRSGQGWTERRSCPCPRCGRPMRWSSARCKQCYRGDLRRVQIGHAQVSDG